MASAERRRRRNHQAAVSSSPFRAETEGLPFRQPGLGHLAGRLRIRPMVAVRSVTEIATGLQQVEGVAALQNDQAGAGSCFSIRSAASAS